MKKQPYNDMIKENIRLKKYPYDGIPSSEFKEAYDHYWGTRIFWGTLWRLGGGLIVGYLIGIWVFGYSNFWG